ncbi:beta-Ala-His dipeptidase [candidate division KSB1 bacterium]
MRIDDERVFYDIIFPHFLTICRLRRPSHEETELINYITEFAQKHSLRHDSDSSGNIAVYRDASPGLENLPPLLFQGHMDMVCVPDKNIWPIEPKISEGWVHTGDRSTLGADNGIAIAYMLELLIMPLEKNPPLECVFTVAEEVGLVGALAMESDKFGLRAPRMVNIDSEDIEYITVGCAGAKNMDITFPVTSENMHASKAFQITVKGEGGHSGLAINDKIPNTIKLAAGLVKSISDSAPFQICTFTGGLARNAIPPESTVVLYSDEISEADLRSAADRLKKNHSDLREFTVDIVPVSFKGAVLSNESSGLLIELLLEIPHGVIKLNEDTGGVFSSNNLAIVEDNDSAMKIILSARSCELSEVDSIFEDIHASAQKYEGVSVEIDEGYPGWRPDMDSELLKITEKIFENRFGKKPQYLDIHAGLECGILMNIFPQVKEAISIGPNIHNAHSVKERLDINTTVDIWYIIHELIKHYSE